jgi:hypothetical protein
MQQKSSMASERTIDLTPTIVKLIRTGYDVLQDSVSRIADIKVVKALCKSQPKRAHCTKGNDWGELRAFKIVTGDDFWSLIAELYDDNSGFVNNKNSLVQAYRDGNLYGLRVLETQAMFERGPGPIFVKRGLWMLPCLCVKDGDEATIVWTHTRARRNGFGRALVEQLSIKTAYNRLEGSEEFWDACLPRP